MNYKFSKHIFALSACLLVFLILGIPYSTIGFDSDCFGLVFFSAQIKSLHELLFSLFKPVQSSYVALNEITAHAPEGFLTYFRPFMTLAHYLCYQIFGLNPYAYHLVNVVLHALTTSCLVYLFSHFLNSWVAFLLALAFAFHPALTPAYIGVTSHVVPGYLFWALMLLAYVKFLKTDEQRWHLLAAFLFLLSLLCYEIIIVFPIVLMLFLIIFRNNNWIPDSSFGLSRMTDQEKLIPHLQWQKSSNLTGTTKPANVTSIDNVIVHAQYSSEDCHPCVGGDPIKNILKKSYLFLITTVGYLAARFYLLGPAASHEQRALALSSLPGKIMFNWYQAVKPFWGLQNNSKLLTIIVTLLFAAMFLITFVQAPERRRRLFFYLVSFILLAWPISLITPDGRYFYPATPFFALIFYEMISHSTNRLPKKYVVTTTSFCLLLFILWGIFHDRQALTTRAFVTQQRDRAFEEIAHYYNNIPDLRLIMIGTLHCYNNDTLLMQQGMTQAARLFFKNPELEAYHVTQAKIYSADRTHHSFHIQQLTNGFRFISPLPEKLFFMIPHTWQEETPIPFSMGTIIVHKKSAAWKASDISFIFDSAWLTSTDLIRTRFVTFDLKLWSFVQLELGEKL